MKLKLLLLYKIPLIILLFFIGFILAVAIFPSLSLCCSEHNARTWNNALKRHWLKSFGRIIQLDISKVGDLPHSPTFVVSNHVSWLDIIVLGQFIPGYFVAKSDISGWPVVGYLARQAGTIFIRRGDKQHIKEIAERMAWLLQHHSNIMAFPEGTTTQGDTVLNFHASLFQPALLTQSTIQPIAIQYTGLAEHNAPFIGDDAFLPHLINILKMDKVAVHVKLLTPISPLDNTRQSISQASRAMILAEVIASE